MAKPTIIDVDVTVVRDVLERARAQLSPEDHTCLASLVQSLIELTRLVRERGTTIARLRRLFGLHNSEKLKDVLGHVVPTNNADATDPPPSSETAPSTSPGGAVEPPSSTPPVEDPAAADNGRDDRNCDGAGEASAQAKRKGHGRIGASEYPDARRIHVEHDRLDSGDACPGCAHGKLYRLPEPARIVRIIGQAPLAATAWECDRLRCSGCGDVFTARAPAEAQGPKYDDSAVAIMGLLRYGTGMPLHRLDRLQRNLETPVPASTQWEVVRDRAGAFEPVHDELCRRAAGGRVQHNDDTSMRILELMGKRRSELVEAGQLPDPDRTGRFTTAIVSVTDAGPIALLFTGRNHAGENFTAVLEQRDPAFPPPIHMCDGLDRNRPRGHVVVESNCLAHGRRHIVDEVDNFPTECRHVLEALGKIFDNEATCRKQALSDDACLAFHQRESGPVMAELEQWLKAELDEHRVEPNSGLGEAFRYLLKRWTQLTLFLRVPGAPLDNNILRASTENGNPSPQQLAVLSNRARRQGRRSLHDAHRHHGAAPRNPFDYLVALLVNEADVAADPAAWLPWTFRATLARASRAAA